MPIAAMRLRRTAMPAVQTVFDPTLSAAGIALSSGNRTATETASESGGMSLSASSKSAGKFYAEYEIAAVGTGNNATSAGIASAGEPPANYAGQTANSYGSWCIFAAGATRLVFNNATQYYVAGGNPSPAVGMRMRLCVDLDSGSLWLSHWGSTAWLGGGDPAAGTTPSFTFSPGTPMRLAACPRSVNAAIRLVLPSDWSSSAPSGFGLWS